MSEAFLSSLLDSIDKKTGKYSDVHLADTTITSSNAVPAAKPDYWAAFPDPTTGKTYYHNYTTNVTQWDKPQGFVELTSAYVKPTIQPTAAELALIQQNALGGGEYAVKATFNKHRGSFEHTGDADYWETKGRQTDKAGRQLQAFVDLDELEKNRAETKAMKDAVQQKMKSIEWSKLNKEKKAQKKRKAAQWLYEEDK